MGYVARFTHAITKDDVGQRVTVRFRLPDGRFRDIVGVLESWHDDVLVLRRRDGSLAHVTAAEIVARSCRRPGVPAHRSA